MGEGKHHVSRSLEFLEVVAGGYVAGKPSVALKKKAVLYNVLTYNQYVGWLAVTVGNVSSLNLETCSLKC